MKSGISAQGKRDVQCFSLLLRCRGRGGGEASMRLYLDNRERFALVIVSMAEGEHVS